jgi:hypothetical protein
MTFTISPGSLGSVSNNTRVPNPSQLIEKGEVPGPESRFLPLKKLILWM